ncbi:MAG: hypothetical protein WCY88_08585 [Spongiibacteraceae bacterium]
MSKALKAALLSGLLIPGAGHLYLKHYPRGITLIAISLACVSALVIEATHQAMKILEQLQAQGGVVSADRIIELATQASASNNGQLSSIASIALVACWLIGLLDAYRLGKRYN